MRPKIQIVTLVINQLEGQHNSPSLPRSFFKRNARQFVGAFRFSSAFPANGETTHSETQALRHDQRNTLNLGANGRLPWQVFGGINLYYGTGFANGSQGIPGSPYNDAYLPGHAQVDLSLGKESREKYTFAVERGECGKPPSFGRHSLTFGGFL